MGPLRKPWNSSHYATAASNTAVVISSGAAGADSIWGFAGAYWSNAGGTPAQTLTIETSPDGASWTTVFVEDITAAGPGFFVPPGGPRYNLTANGYVRGTLSAPGSGVTSKLWLDIWKENSRAPIY